MLTSIVSSQQINITCKNIYIYTNIKEENYHIFWATWGISMTFSEKMWLMIILKVTKELGFTISIEKTFLGKQQVGLNWAPSYFRVK